MRIPLRPGLLVLHGNRLESLAQTVFAWLAANPLRPLEEETFLVQSNGMAEWLKMELAAAHGICAATRVDLPARFIWRAYRAVLGRAAVPSASALDKQPLTWRLMRLLPRLMAPAEGPGVFEPLATFLRAGAGSADASRRLQLAQRLADLFDQYQVYRADWLDDWAAGHDRLRPASGSPHDAPALQPDQAWQAALWRQVLAHLDNADLRAARHLLHRQFLQALGEPNAADRPHDAAAPRFATLPRRVVLFGTTQIPHQTLEAVAALSAHAQVLLAVPNPCRFHWADTIAGRELLLAERRRQPLRGQRELADVHLQDMHAHGHPLLTAWGRQSRDFVRQLDAFDDAPRARAQFAAAGVLVPRVDLFDEEPGVTVLQQVQAHIRDLLPVAELPATVWLADDRSIVFHIAHSAQREVEVLHDQLLHLLAQPAGDADAQAQPALNPRDIVVMVPDIETFAPAIRAVFGQHARRHPRHIPWGIADQRDRGQHPLLRALEWLLRVSQQRFTFSEWRDLMNVPAVARCLNLQPADVAVLGDWVQGAGVRWGLHAEQRAQLDLAACGDVNTWRFGLRRMLMGYATGDLGAQQAGSADGLERLGIEPFAEVAGLSAGLVGALDLLLQRLQDWWVDAPTPRTPDAWGLRLRALLQAFFKAADDDERALLAAVDEALGNWLLTCERAGFDELLDLAVVREAWLEGVDEPGLARRFKAGGVTFCTLLPMRAIPFEVVCLLGMNDGDYPRRSPRSDFDLMALPCMARPGDRSRRDDDRQLMLDALLSARRVLHISWAGRSPRDNSEQPPSVLVSQLRDHLAAAWTEAAVKAHTTEHPLQPFSRRYFEAAASEAAGLLTYATEWRSAHEDASASSIASFAVGVPPSTTAPAPDDSPQTFTLEALTRFLRNPVKAYFAQRLRVRFDEHPAGGQDDEHFVTAGLDRWQLMDSVLQAARTAHRAAPTHALDVRPHLQRLQRAGQLPMAGPGQQAADALMRTLQPMLVAWQEHQARHPQALDAALLRWPTLASDEPALQDAASDLRSAGHAAALPLWVDLQASRLTSDAKHQKLRPEKLLGAWLRALLLAACEQPARGVLIGADVIVQIACPEPEAARDVLDKLLQAARVGLTGNAPLPTAVETGVALLRGNADRARTAYEGSVGGGGKALGEGREPCLARLFPSFAALSQAPYFEDISAQLYGDFSAWLSAGVMLEPLPGHVEFDDGDGGDGDGDGEASGEGGDRDD